MGHDRLHSAEHTDGTDDIQTATAGQKGLASSAQITKLDGIQSGAKSGSTKFVEGLSIAPNGSNPNFQIDIAPGSCRNDADDDDILNSGTITVDITASGANGLDTGSEAASTWYFVWLIYNPTTSTTAGLLSTSPTSPTMPSGYTKKRRIGVVRNHSTSNFLRFVQTGDGKNRRYSYSEPYNITVVLAAGSSSPWNTLDCSSYAPSTSRLIEFMYQQPVASAFGLFSQMGWTSTITFPWFFGTLEYLLIVLPCDSSQRLQWGVSSGGSLSLWVKGFWDVI